MPDGERYLDVDDEEEPPSCACVTGAHGGGSLALALGLAGAALIRRREANAPTR
jgi:MYXO-CTERM domain-containing protein